MPKRPTPFAHFARTHDALRAVADLHDVGKQKTYYGTIKAYLATWKDEEPVVITTDGGAAATTTTTLF